MSYVILLGMKDKSLLDIVKSTFTVVFISAIGALACYLFHLSFWASFLLFFVFQYILFSFAGNLISNYFIQQTRQKELDVLEPLSTFLECAYCKEVNIMTFLPNQNERIEFDCDKCKNKNLVNIAFTVARITDSVNIPSLTGVPLIDEKE
jgi:hypothetical protein